MWLSDLRICHLGGKWIELLAPLSYLKGGTVFTIPKGFVCDGASVPRFPLAYWLTGNTAHRAAVLHDMLYRWHFESRECADRLFYEAMNEPRWRRRAMYRAVRMFGGFAFKGQPGRLDPRKPNEGRNHYADWRQCKMPYSEYAKQIDGGSK